MTNRHVVAEVGLGGLVKIRPMLPPKDGRSTLGSSVEGVVRALHPDLDLAVIELLPPIPPEIKTLPAVSDSSLLPRGTEVLIHGFPATSVPTVSRGIVSGHHHDFSDDEPLYLLDAASGSGSSGGPVTDRAGTLIGVATAVYDTRASQELGFAWCFAIPVSHVRTLFDENGGIRPTQATATVDELVHRVLNSEEGSARVVALGDAMAILVRSRTSVLSVVSDCATLLERSAGSITLDSESSSRQFMEVLLAQGAVNARRGAQLVLSGDETMENPEQLAKLTELESRTRSLGQEIMARSLARLDEQKQAEVLFGMLEAISVRAEELRRGLPATSERLEPLTNSDPQAVRGTARESFLSALSELIMSQLILDMASRLPTPTENELRNVPPRARAALRRLQAATVGLTAAWKAMPEAVRSLAVAPAGAVDGAEAVRDELRSEGFIPVADAAEDFGLPGGGTTRARQIGGAGSIAAVAFLAESLGGADIDLELRSPSGQLVATDRGGDGYPLVVAQDPMLGNWRVQLINSGGRTISVHFEIWEKRRR